MIRLVLTHARIEAARADRWASALLFLTDRCPVGCRHCSVDARADGPRISDWPMFEAVVGVLCATPGFRVIGISGGEPFAERRGLEFATRRLAEAGKEIVVYTSGHWGRSGGAPQWIRAVLARASCVVLGTDAFHAERIPPARVAAAVRAVRDAGAWLVAQSIGTAEPAAGLLTRALGPDWADHAEIHLTALLPHGRAGDLAGRAGAVPGHRMGPCRVADAPVIRYDGRVSACCNEAVIGGAGPAALRRQAHDAGELRDALDEFGGDGFFHFVSAHGPGPLTALPAFTDLAGQQFRSVCELCWRMLRRTGTGREGALGALALFAATAHEPAAPGTDPAGGSVEVRPDGVQQ